MPKPELDENPPGSVSPPTLYTDWLVSGGAEKWDAKNSGPSAVPYLFLDATAQAEYEEKFPVGSRVRLTSEGLAPFTSTVVRQTINGGNQWLIEFSDSFPSEWTVTTDGTSLEMYALPDEGDVLVYNATTQEWSPQQPSGVGLVDSVNGQTGVLG